MVFETGTLVLETKTVVSKPETIVLAAGTMVFLIKKIFSLEETTVFGIDTMVCVKNTMVRRTWWNTMVHGCEDNGVGCADYGVQGFIHRSIDRRTELRQSPAGCFWSSSPLTSFLLREIHRSITIYCSRRANVTCTVNLFSLVARQKPLTATAESSRSTCTVQKLSPFTCTSSCSPTLTSGVVHVLVDVAGFS